MKVLLADSHEIVREGLRARLDDDSRYQVIGTVDDGIAAVGMAKKLSPDVVVMDIALPGLNGVEAARQIIAESKGAVKVLVLSMHATREFVIEAFRVGVSGYISKACTFKELLQALDEVAQGRTHLSPSIADLVIEHYVRREGSEGSSHRPPLTPRERQIVQLLADGHSAKRIAGALDISHKTVHAVRAQVMAKISAKSTVDLVKYAIRNGLTTLD